MILLKQSTKVDKYSYNKNPVVNNKITIFEMELGIMTYQISLRGDKVPQPMMPDSYSHGSPTSGCLSWHPISPKQPTGDIH